MLKEINKDWYINDKSVREIHVITTKIDSSGVIWADVFIIYNNGNCCKFNKCDVQKEEAQKILNELRAKINS